MGTQTLLILFAVTGGPGCWSWATWATSNEVIRTLSFANDDASSQLITDGRAKLHVHFPFFCNGGRTGGLKTLSLFHWNLYKSHNDVINPNCRVV